MNYFIVGVMVGMVVFASVLLFMEIDSKSSVIVLAPTLTAHAYQLGGFYNYFLDECDESCLSIPINHQVNYSYASSSNALILLGDMGYDIILDSTDINQVNEYDTLVVLHNEYITQEMFDVITNHPNVFYLYPNALYGLVEYENGIMTLISGHSYDGKDNAFDWVHENTRPDEFDNECLTAQWLKVSNGYQLNCYPENVMLKLPWILDFIEDNGK